MRWGLIPFWAKDAQHRLQDDQCSGRRRSPPNPAFRDALRKTALPDSGRRILRVGEERQDEDAVLFHHGRRLDLRLRWDLGFVDATRKARSSRPAPSSPRRRTRFCADVHDRMPVILPDDAYDLWLDPGFQKTDAICDLLKPFDPDLMRRYEVSSRVNLVKNDDPACAEPVLQPNAVAPRVKGCQPLTSCCCLPVHPYPGRKLSLGLHVLVWASRFRRRLG